MPTKYINTERLIHSTKTVIACIIGLLFARFIGFPSDQWIVITIIVVMCAQIYVGSVIQKAYLRFLGTLVGCLFATIAILTIGHNDLSVVVAIGLSSFIFSYIATQQETLTYAGTLGAVTTAIIMLGQTPTIPFAAERFLEISIGLLIATLVSQFILPIHASTHLRRAQAKTLKQLHDYYEEIIIEKPKSAKLDYSETDEEIVKSIIKQRQLAKESVSERIGPKFNTTQFMKSLFCEREILRAISFMNHALLHVKQTKLLFTQSAAAKNFNSDILLALNTLTEVIESGKLAHKTLRIPSINGFRADIQQRVDIVLSEDTLYIDGFLFSAEVICNNLSALATLYRIPILPPEAPTLSLISPSE